MYGIAIYRHILWQSVKPIHIWFSRSICLMVLLDNQTRCTNARRTNFEDLNQSIYIFIVGCIWAQELVWISMNMLRLYTLYHQSLVRSSHLTWDVWSHALLQSTITFDIFSFLYFILNAKHPLFHQGLRKFHSIYMILEDTYFTIFSFDWHHRLVAMWCDIAP